MTMGVWTAVGIAVGAAMGSVTGHVGTWVASGVALAVAFGGCREPGWPRSLTCLRENGVRVPHDAGAHRAPAKQRRVASGPRKRPRDARQIDCG
jgi:hypothetical protein